MTRLIHSSSAKFCDMFKTPKATDEDEGLSLVYFNGAYDKLNCIKEISWCQCRHPQ